MEFEIYKMTYKIEKNNTKLRILGEYFVKNNKNKGKLMFNNKKYSLKHIISVKDIRKNIMQIILNKNIYNKSCMFKNCESLESVSKLSCDNINNENDSQYLNRSHTNNYLNDYDKTIKEEDNDFYKGLDTFGCSEISEMKEENSDKSVILYLNYKLKYPIYINYTLLKEMFSNCKSLSSLPDISELDTSKVIDMSYMFYNCASLSSLPDICKMGYKKC